MLLFLVSSCGPLWSLSLGHAGEEGLSDRNCNSCVKEQAVSSVWAWGCIGNHLGTCDSQEDLYDLSHRGTPVPVFVHDQTVLGLGKKSAHSYELLCSAAVGCYAALKRQFMGGSPAPYAEILPLVFLSSILKAWPFGKELPAREDG